ncbi:MAG: NADH-quinone oxidoreductase subunit NuoH [Anaerolineaceae bacterium]|nr:NADH-quinone oxidoreductase subunit NuoH [Anaerolineaceae bacterium]
MGFLNFLFDPISSISTWLSSLLAGWGLSNEIITPILYLIGAGVLGTGALLVTLLLIWAERKIIGRVQDRFGPNRVGPWGIFQSVADMVKIFIKEHIIPSHVDPIPYHLAPILAVSAVLLSLAVVPLSKTTVGTNLNVGLLFIIAVGGLGELAILMAGWGSNNKYAIIAAFRATAQLISYELPMVITLIIPVLLTGSMGMVDLVEAQKIPFILAAPLAALIFFIASIAENGRAPFDLAEAESELVAGFNTEYSGLKFGMFYVADFLRAFTSSIIFVSIFLGGWQGPWAVQIPILGFVYLLIKSVIVWFVGVWIRGSLPRFRIDQMVDINWKILTPVSLILVLLTAFIDKGLGLSSIYLRYIVLFLLNIGVGALVIQLIVKQVKKTEVQVDVGSRERLVARPENMITIHHQE